MNKFTKLLICTLLILSILTPIIPSFASDDLKMKSLSNLKALGGSWKFGDTIESSGEGDLFALSETEAENFVFEANVEFVNKSGAASLVLFSGDNPSHGSYIANIDLSAGNARIFTFESSGGASTKGEYILNSEMRAKNKFNLRVEAENGEMVYFLDGAPVISISNASAKYGKRLGLLTFNTSVKYTNVSYCILDEKLPTLSSVGGISAYFTGKKLTKEKLAYGTTEVKLTLGTSTDDIEVKAIGASAKREGKAVKISNIKDSFGLVILLGKNAQRSYVISFTVELDPDTLYYENYRSHLHFSPYQNWINDPNGLVYDPSDSMWHMFFQYNPFGMNIGNQVWGHAVSSDLMHWKELDTAIEQDDLGAVFSGSAVVDSDNTTGFFTDNKPGESMLVALFTSHGGDTTHGTQKQCIAYSKDHGVTWIRPDKDTHGFENPVISNANNKYGNDFRDPKIFRYDGKWFMVIAGGRARLFSSDNLIDWTMVCDMGFDSECPDLYPLPLDGDENNVKWVYTASGKWYVIGRLEKISETSYKFIEESTRTTYNGGSEIYATQSFYNDGSSENRRIAISWIVDNSATNLTGKTWNGFMSLPYEQTLRTANGKMILTSNPVSETELLRSDKVIDLDGTISDTINSALNKNPGNAYDIQLSFKPEKDSVITFTLRKGTEHEVTVLYNAQNSKLRVVRGKASPAGSDIPAGTLEMPLYPDKDGNIKIRIIMDISIIEVFGNDGEAALCGAIFPGDDAINSYFSASGSAVFNSFEMWRVTSIWHEDEVVIPKSGLYLDISNSLGIDKEITLYSYMINERGEKVSASTVWEGVDGKIASVVSKSDGSITIKGLIKGEIHLKVTSGSESKTFKLKVSETGFITNLEN